MLAVAVGERWASGTSLPPQQFEIVKPKMKNFEVLYSLEKTVGILQLVQSVIKKDHRLN